MNESLDIWVRTLVTAAALGLALWELVVSRGPGRVGSRHGQPRQAHRAALLLLTGLSLFTYLGFGGFRTGNTFVHYWEQFHYALGSKYFAELGYDGLYAASVAAQRESDGERPSPGTIRDLSNNHLVAVYAVRSEVAAAPERFSPERWAEFRKDHSRLIAGLDDANLHGVRQDHGFNPTPTWTFVAQSLTAWVPFHPWSFVLFGALDLLLLAAAAGLIYRTYGGQTAAWFLLLLGIGYAWRFSWVGGSLLRQLWFFSVVAAVCALKTRRFVAGGSLLALSMMLRVFPGAFFVGPLVVALRDRRRSYSLGWFRRFLLGATVTITLSLVTGSLAGRGFSAWSEFAQNLEKHRHTWLTNNVGLTVPLVWDVWIERPQIPTPTPLEPGLGWKEALDETVVQRRAAIAVFTFALLFLGAGAAWQSTPDEAMLLGPLMVFAIAPTTSYYWIMLLLMLLRRPPAWSRVALLLLNLGACILHLRGMVLYALYGFGSWAILLLLVGWSLQIAWQGEGARATDST